jgi:hypothetical protein
MTPKDALHELIDELSDAECQHIIMLLDTWKHSPSSRLTMLANNPAFQVPAQGLVRFQSVNPIQGQGIDASTQLIEDRR